MIDAQRSAGETSRADGTSRVVHPPAGACPGRPGRDGARRRRSGAGGRDDALGNQGSVIIGGEANWVTWIRVGVNYLTPSVVASIGYLAGCRAEGGTA